MENKVLRCQDCYTQFVFTAIQQQKYADNGWADPIRCPRCRDRKKKRWSQYDEYARLMQGATMRIYSCHGRGFFRKLGR